MIEIPYYLMMSDKDSPKDWRLGLVGTYKFGFSRLSPKVNAFIIITVTFFTMIMIAFGFVWYLAGPQIAKWTATETSIQTAEILDAQMPKEYTEEEINIAADNQFKVKKALEHKEMQSSAHISKMNSGFRREMQSMFDINEFSILNCIAISYWTVHNGGKTQKVDKNSVLEVYISSSRRLERDYSSVEKAEIPPIFQGFRWLADEMILEDEPLTVFYADDVTKYPDMYLGKAKAEFKRSGNRAFYATMLHNEGKTQHFISMDFDIINPKENSPNSYVVFEEMADKISEMLFYGNYGLDESSN